jgi:Ala-tRNA(Pro) deacylase
MRVTEFLDKSKVKYKVSEHHPAFTAQHMAAEEHEPGKYVAKPVIVKADDKYLMCVLPRTTQRPSSLARATIFLVSSLSRSHSNPANDGKSVPT